MRHHLPLLSLALAWAACGPATSTPPSPRVAKWSTSCGPRTSSGGLRLQILDYVSGEPLEAAQAGIRTAFCLAFGDKHGRAQLHHVPAGQAQVQVRWIGFIGIDTTIRVEAGRTESIVIRLRRTGPQPFTLDPLPPADLTPVVTEALRFLVANPLGLLEHASGLREYTGTDDAEPPTPVPLLDLRSTHAPAWLPLEGLPAFLAATGLAGACTRTEPQDCARAGFLILYDPADVTRLGPDSVYVRVHVLTLDLATCFGDVTTQAPLLVRHRGVWEAIGKAEIGALRGSVGCDP